ncbi:hypothetical protein LWF15_12290 [Kineosporia rhizophila]|uniref:hypothetical protein n=1 Tax=Kineosporia TaxID=49184 RepID=UPI001E3294F2|nr:MULTISPECIES: hypothetical protein [Kineosporia]MCE0536288.1 hypothetical protein [Kineosporia rhizophila]GLY15126.1 hypothetical protein Kisp01_21410 [Kineosporia sp. NBRC 101677]
MSTSETQPAATGWSLLMPSTWSRIRLRTDRREQVSALVGRAFGSISRDQGPALRRALERELLSLADEAFNGGGREFYVLTEIRRGLPVAATCVVTVVPQPVPPGVDAEILARVLANAPGSEPTTVTVGEDVVPAVRRSEPKRFRSQEEGAEPFKVTFTGLDVYVPFPDGSQILLLTFRTPMEQIAEPMSVLFEAIAGSLRFREG